jgi:hypothetical protein
VGVLEFPVMLKKLIVFLLITRVGLADQNLINKVEPTVPPLAKTLEIGGTVELDIIISQKARLVPLQF